MYVDDTLCDVIGCYGYDVNSAAAAAQGGEGHGQVYAGRSASIKLYLLVLAFCPVFTRALDLHFYRDAVVVARRRRCCVCLDSFTAHGSYAAAAAAATDCSGARVVLRPSRLMKQGNNSASEGGRRLAVQ